MKRLLSLLLALLMLVTMFTACAGSSTTQQQTTTEATSSTEAESTASGEETLKLTFYYPVNIGGAVPNLIDQMVEGFEKENPGIEIEAVYTGNYSDNAVQVVSAFQAGSPPDFFLYDYTSCLDIIASGYVSPLDELVAADPDGEEYIADFLDGFMVDAHINGVLYSIPFQRSTEIMYYNKDAFREVGLDPEAPPTTWDELLEYAQKLTKKDADGNVTRWGIGIDGDNAQWWLGGMCLQNSTDGSNLMNSDGTEVYFDTPEVKEALQFVCDLSQKYEVMPTGIQKWTDLPTQFLDGQYAMIYHTSGNLTNIADNANFEFGAAFLPGNKRNGACTGGGSFYISEGISQERKEAAWKFIRYVTSPEAQAQWNIDTGYVAVRKSAQDTEIMKEYFEKMPQAKVAMDQVVYAGPELTVNNTGIVWDALNDNITAALIGEKSVSDALDDAQAKADKALEDYK